MIHAENSVLRKYAYHIERVDSELKELLNSQVPLINEMGRHILLGNGKRLRPLFFILSCELCGYQGDDLYRLAAIFEGIHTASLLHDDVLDKADIRRNKPSANHVWGNHAAVLEGDFLHSRSSSIAVGSNNLRFLGTITSITTQMTEGQILELMHTNDWNTSKEEYMEIIRAKTAVLISGACACGAIIAGSSENWVQALEKFGLNMGISFQLIDDLLDYLSSEEKFGKPVGKDLREGKITLPLIYTLADMEKKKKAYLQDLFQSHEATEADYLDLIDLVRNSGAVERIKDEARSYVTEAADCLGLLPDSSAKASLMELNSFIVERTY
ncbi:MAG: polyprenyl synthetase family protein [Desulfatiglans sp.]|jgi:octaprenyl-diphosphate synthase|nr:polyprenyl synthetase family protein [Thermodesulfobacteriota bacterium]MEE4351700.1 polyprenyl synthetase family protein [Desulfatiglans sp.]